MLEREVPCFGERKSTVVGGSSTNLLRKATKQQQHGELVLRVQQLEATIVAMQQQGPKIGLPMKLDGTRSQFKGFLNKVRLIIQMC